MIKKLMLALCLVSVTAGGHALANTDYPSKPIVLVLGFPPGGGADHVGRVYANALAKELGQPVIVENRPGAGATIAASFAARAKPDGYTLFLGNSSVMGSDTVLYKVNYTPDNFDPIIQLTTGPMILIASKKSGITSVAELIRRAKANPNDITFSSSGNGVITHLAAVEFMQNQGVEMLHIPHSGGAAATQSVATGDVDISFATAPSARPVIDIGKAVGLGITSSTASEVLSSYQPIASQGAEGYDISNWWGIFAPAGTPQAVKEKLFTASKDVLGQPELIEVMRSGYEDVTPSHSLAEFETFARTEGALGLKLAELSRASQN